MDDLKAIINNPSLDMQERLGALRTYARMSQKTKDPLEINNHIHTIYSFSPYTPSMAALLAREASLAAAGSVDHDSIAAAEEMLEACKILGIGGCVGFEVRVSFKTGSNGKSSPFAGKKINSADFEGYAYMTVQGIPARHIAKAKEFLSPLREERLKRSRDMTVSVNILLKDAGFAEIDFEKDIVNCSKYMEDGGITERHILSAMAEKLIEKLGKGINLTRGLKSKFGVEINPKILSYLDDPNNIHYQYDLLGVLKSEFLPRVYILPNEDECIPVNRVTAFAKSINAIPFYPYLGDVKESPTGDKKEEKFEDDYIEELFEELSLLGFKALTYMPPRNTPEQLRTLRDLSSRYGFMEISGVDINSSRQSFNCPEVLQKDFRHLIDTTWALIAHEQLAGIDEKLGLFSIENPLASLDLDKRIASYAVYGKKLNLQNPGETTAVIAKNIWEGKH